MHAGLFQMLTSISAFASAIAKPSADVQAMPHSQGCVGCACNTDVLIVASAVIIVTSRTITPLPDVAFQAGLSSLVASATVARCRPGSAVRQRSTRAGNPAGSPVGHRVQAR